MGEANGKRWGYGVGLALIVLAGLALRAHDLGVDSFWIDEIYSVRLTRLPFTQMGPLIPPDKPMLDYVLQWPFLRLRDSEWTARLPACLYGALAILAVAMAARWATGRKGGDRTAALCAAAMVAAAPFAVRYSQEARPYSLAFLCVAAAMGFLLRADATRAPVRSRTWYGFAIFSVLATYTLFFGWIFVALSLAWLVARAAGAGFARDGATARLHAWRAVSLAVAALVFNVPFFMRMATAVRTVSHAPFDAASWEAALGYLNLLGAAYDQKHGLLLGAVPVALVFVPFALWGLARVWRVSRWGAGFLALQWIGGAAVAIAFFAMRNHWLHARYLYFAMPGYYALLGIGLAGAGEWLAQRAQRRWTAAIPATALALVALGWVFACPFERPAWRPWARYAADETAGIRNREIVALSSLDELAMRYYFGRWRQKTNTRTIGDWRRIVRRARGGRTLYVCGADRERQAPRPPAEAKGVRIEKIDGFSGVHAWRVGPTVASGN